MSLVRDRRTGIDMVLVMAREFLTGSPESERGRARETVVWRGTVSDTVSRLSDAEE